MPTSLHPHPHHTPTTGRSVPLLHVPLTDSDFKLRSFQCGALITRKLRVSLLHTQKLTFLPEGKKVQAWFRGEEKRWGALLDFHGNSLPHYCLHLWLEEGGKMGVSPLLSSPSSLPFRLGGQGSGSLCPTQPAGWTPPLQAQTLGPCNGGAPGRTATRARPANSNPPPKSQRL